MEQRWRGLIAFRLEDYFRQEIAKGPRPSRLASSLMTLAGPKFFRPEDYSVAGAVPYSVAVDNLEAERMRRVDWGAQVLARGLSQS